ncbi:Zinc finger, C3HC4 RING-type [Dillenia turbinata]|uniref:E3 ubiquitin protein ligase n=1 Tax=Dillenia turbinata TaxID=194707 RepID=A0AAN8V071_9MAGN
MGSTGEPDRKRRHFSSISPTAAAAAAKKQPFCPPSEDKKIDTAVLQFQNQKLVQKLEAQKVESQALENKVSLLKEKRRPYNTTLTVVKNHWRELVDDFESSSINVRNSASSGRDAESLMVVDGGSSSAFDDAFTSRLTETGATESCFCGPGQPAEDAQTESGKTKNALSRIVAVLDSLCSLKDHLCAVVLKAVPEDVRNLRLQFSNLRLKYKELAKELQNHRDADAKNKAELETLRGEFEITIGELEESNQKLVALKSERDAANNAVFPVLSLGNKQVTGDRARDKQKDLQDMESALKDLLDQSSSRLVELRCLHEERIEILRKLSTLQNSLKNVKSIFSSHAYLLVKDQLAKSRLQVNQCQALYEKLQVEKENLAWREREMHMKSDLVDVLRRSSAVAESRITELESEIKKLINERNLIEAKLEEASREPRRKDIIGKFKLLVSSFPDDMGGMQSQLSKYKEAAADIHSLRADMQSFTSILDRKTTELETFLARSAEQVSELKKLQAVAQELKESDIELRMILEMYGRESSDTREVLEARDLEYRAWAHVELLKSSLDEHSLELRVKKAIEAEAAAQQRLAASEAEIADLRQKLEISKREMARLTEVLKSKHEENEAYLYEIETIGQAYDDMQTQNQHHLQQVTERDDYNIKLVLEGLRTRQLQDALLMDKVTMEKEIQQANTSLDLYGMKATRIEDQLKICSEQVLKLAEDRSNSSISLETTQKKLLDVRKTSQQVRESLEESQTKAEKNRLHFAELQIELEKKRFDKKRMEEELELARIKALRLRAQIEGSSVLGKLKQDLREFKEILKCSICLDRPKEVVITKCYHLFCNPCVQKIMETRHRRCPMCSACFGPNDVKPVYI